MKGDGAETEFPQQNGYPLGFIYCAGEDDGGLSGELVDEEDEVDVLVNNWYEEVFLDQGRHSLILVGTDRYLERVLQTGTLEALDLGRHGGTKKESSPFTREKLENLV